MLAARPAYDIDYEADAKWVHQSILAKTEYDLFLTDLMMPGMGGVELIRFLNSNNHQTPIMALSSVEDPAVVTQVLELGVMGYLPKSYSVFQILDAIDDCLQGNIHVPGFLSASLQASPVEPQNKSAAPHALLTPREVEILSLMDKGLSNQEIADYLFISKATVKTHVNHMFKTLKVNNRVNCLRAARHAGLLSYQAR
jgi:DNA-binding NarL/FixJ family response regulator